MRRKWSASNDAPHLLCHGAKTALGTTHSRAQCSATSFCDALASLDRVGHPLTVATNAGIRA
jgi:hypothetical protein